MKHLIGRNAASDILLMKQSGDTSFLIEYNLDTLIFHCSRVSSCAELGFKLSRFLWILKGANSIESLSYYDNKVMMKSDNGHNLRGPYRPRLRYWVGADQLQEAINKNSNIDDPMDFVKPKGIDQLNRVFKDLSTNMNVSGCVVFDPSIDFEDSNDIPDLYSFIFKRDPKRHALDLFLNYGTMSLVDNYVNDCFVFFMLQRCFANLFCLSEGNVFINIADIAEEEIKEISCKGLDIDYINALENLPRSLNEIEFWQDIFHLFDFEKHMRCAIYKDSVNSSQIALPEYCDKLMEKFLEPIVCDFWRDYGRVLMICALKRYGKIKYQDKIEEIMCNITSFLKQELTACLAFEDNHG